MATPALQVEGLWWRYPTHSDEENPWILRDIALRVEQGECFGITGPSGAGKTTLCRTLMGILPYSTHLTTEQLPHHYRGSIEVLGEPVSSKTASSHRIGMVMQDPENQFLRMSLLHELALGLQIQGVSDREILARSHEALRWVGLEHLWQGAVYRHPADLSGGQKQRVAIAAFLALRPQVLILDEPTSDLDPVGKREVIATIARLRRDYQITVILVEQDPDILSAFCDRIALVHEGRVELVATPQSFYSQRSILEESGTSVSELVRISWSSGYSYETRPPLTLAEGESAFSSILQYDFPVDVHPVIGQKSASWEQNNKGAGEVKEDWEKAVGSRRDVAGQEREGIVSERELVVQARDVVYRYEDGSLALKGVNLDLHRGEMLALLGPNGSGKTTFAKILAGIYAPQGGQIQVMGQDIKARKMRRSLSRYVGYVFQNPDHQLFRRTVRDEIEYGLKNLGMAIAQRQERVNEVLEAVHLTPYANEDPMFLSKGQRQRLAVAAVLAMGPDILVVDEPTTGQDYRSITGIMQLLCALQQQGKTILIITHDMTLVAEYCQRVVTFRDGVPGFTGTPLELFDRQEILEKTGLRPPISAALANRMRERKPDLPPLLTVEQWVKVLCANGVLTS